MTRAAHGDARDCLTPGVVASRILPSRATTTVSRQKSSQSCYNTWRGTRIVAPASEDGCWVTCSDERIATSSQPWFLIHCSPSINSLAPGKFEWNFRYAIFKRISVIDGWGISCEIALIWMSWDFTDDQSTLVQVMAWCRQATSHYLSQCGPRSLSPYGVTRPEWVNFSNMPALTTDAT